jgi:hypothetical protein
LLAQQLAPIDCWDETLEPVSAEIARRLHPFDERYRQQRERRHGRGLEQLGYTVTLTPTEPAA